MKRWRGRKKRRKGEIKRRDKRMSGEKGSGSEDKVREEKRREEKV